MSRLSHQRCKDITYHTGITSFGKQEHLLWINSPVYYFNIPAMTLEFAITSQISDFILVNSPLHW